ncbi:hypothetical protein KGF57_001333 [Candida theae]|uniref:Kinetochore protein SPC25 n=1 Tax=Candida theae TaxID=1198502 RepID=A0AAD5BHA3_9ASCO|nr:uncharacterized protein KGF57_001333 [Candida theae]KAI5962894.1 hypothetical protein KGF57_001333 [Candida theae]
MTTENKIDSACEGLQNRFMEFDSLKVELDQFLEGLDNALTNKQADFSHQKHVHQQQTIERKGVNDQLRKQISNLSSKETSKQQQVTDAMRSLKENEEKVVKDNQERNQLQEAVKEVEDEIKKLNQQAAKIHDELRSSNEAFEERMQSHLEVELVYGLFTGLRIEPIDDTQIKLGFFNLDPNNLERNFSVVVDVAGENYQIGETNPPLSREFLENAQLELNRHGRLSRFLKQVWSQFDLLASR